MTMRSHLPQLQRLAQPPVVMIREVFGISLIRARIGVNGLGKLENQKLVTDVNRRISTKIVLSLVTVVTHHQLQLLPLRLQFQQLPTAVIEQTSGQLAEKHYLGAYGPPKEGQMRQRLHKGAKQRIFKQIVLRHVVLVI